MEKAREHSRPKAKSRRREESKNEACEEGPTLEYLTTHAIRRTRERLGVPKRSARRAAERALELGYKRENFSGAFGAFLDTTRERHNNGNMLRVYKDYLYIFENGILITMFLLPPQYRGVRAKKESRQ